MEMKVVIAGVVVVLMLLGLIYVQNLRLDVARDNTLIQELQDNIKARNVAITKSGNDLKILQGVLSNDVVMNRQVHKDITKKESTISSGLAAKTCEEAVSNLGINSMNVAKEFNK